MKDPLEKLKKKMESNTTKFSLKQVKLKKVKEALKKIKKKKSAGLDGLSQEKLVIILKFIVNKYYYY